MCNATLEEAIQAWMAADDQTKMSALRILQGEQQTTVPNQVPSGPQLVTMGKACELLGCSRTTLWRAIQAGALKKVELFKNSYRLRLDDVLVLTNRKEVS